MNVLSILKSKIASIIIKNIINYHKRELKKLSIVGCLKMYKFLKRENLLKLFRCLIKLIKFFYIPIVHKRNVFKHSSVTIFI